MAFPTSPINGQIATVNGIRYSYASATQSWTRISNAKYTAAASAPSNPSLGDEWYNTNLDTLFQYINDGITSYWVDIQSLGTTGNIITISDATLSGNIVVGVDNRYTIGAPSAALKNIYVNSLSLLNIGDVSANVGTIRTNLNTLDANVGAYETYANTKIGTNTNSNLVVVATTPSTSTTTGALVIGGGAGIAGNAVIGGNVTFGAGYTETVYSVVDAAGVPLSPFNGSIQTWTLGASRTPTAGPWLAGQSMTLMIDDGTAYTITWTSVTWGGTGVIWTTNGGSAPTLATSGYTTIVLWKVGTQVYGARVGNA